MEERIEERWTKNPWKCRYVNYWKNGRKNRRTMNEYSLKIEIYELLKELQLNNPWNDRYINY
jgi:hypothetical protein